MNFLRLAILENLTQENANKKVVSVFTLRHFLVVLIKFDEE